MSHFVDSVKSSAKNCGSIQVIAVCGMLLAMKTVLGSFTIMVTPYLKIGFASLPIAAAGMLFGPVAGGIMGGLGDIISYLLKPSGPYFPGLTISGIIGGFIYGLLLYRKPVTLLRTALTKVLVFICVSLLLDPFWLCVMYGKSFIVILAERFTAQIVTLPIHIFVLYATLKILVKATAFLDSKEHRAAN